MSEAGLDTTIIAEDTDTITFPVWFTAEGVYNQGLRTADEIERIVPLVGGLPLIKDHPPTPVVPTDAITYGIIFDPEVVEKDGLKTGKGKVTIVKEDHPDIVKGVKSGKNVEVSLGYWFDKKLQGGDYKGNLYNHIRTNIIPTHVALLIDQTPAACPPPLCNIGLDSGTTTDSHDPSILYNTQDGGKAKIFIPGMDTQNNDSQKSEGCNMTEEPTTPPIIKTAEKPLGLSEIGIDALLKENLCVQKLAKQNKDLTTNLDKARVGLDALAKEVEALKPFKAEADERERKEVEALRSEVTASEVFSKEEVAAMGKDRLEVALKALKSVQKTTPGKIPAPGKDSHNKPASGLTVGVPVRNAEGKLEWLT